ncbi:hypothetical protein M2459_001337 [Parabacteroides sp. PF5-5]|uniref:KilA-N domain-containing protein n=1 Tax=unclassified Parabacteroides TaxID=2649774 RepID=UPI0024753031|nr:MULTISPECIES: KilA-N domain-containing protein [unclassified Parabacteroides]MDH6304602.1 hypothetical protein [Parabacteroides sp. PH5-39]MDH6315785.1 hypothetical protein [Parabacteroides sp. PF5-13]MDH6319444.1 hypothetical protein [Parabacteroides sp. PH5-13]MDH6323175.1 hypothetical protein [Parabacteroides sp. PH5-8]MDH6326977.1 hypothetical protein [Parabacteroides sp. PH5-41]
MKTNQVLTRKMGEFDVLQRTSDGMFNATTLLKQWNNFSGQQKEITKFFDNDSTKEFIKALISEENLHTQNSAYVKSRASRGSNAGTWMHPLLFIDFAMWLNPTFKVKVLRFVYDQLILFRNEAGDAYKEMSGAIATLVEKNMTAESIKRVARAVNYIVYNLHESDIRNKQADEAKMKELFELERRIAQLVGDGFIKSYDHLIDYLRTLWQKKWQPKELIA